jgi:hypothetical protein
MNVTLASTWYPRGETNRLQLHIHELQACYAQIIIITPPEKDLSKRDLAEVSELNRLPGILVRQPDNWSGGRYAALQVSLETNSSFIQYADLDRLLRWVETRPDEWLHTLKKLMSSDSLIIGRTPFAYLTHPTALVQTEAISNQVVSHFLGRFMDVSAGSKGFCREAADYIVANTVPGHAMGTDAQWPILLHQAGFKIDYIEVDGLDWESADRYKDHAAKQEDQLQAAVQYDADPRNWEHRVEIAREIVESALAKSARQTWQRE